MDLFLRYKTRDKTHHLGGSTKNFIKSRTRIIEKLEKPASKKDNVIYIHIPFCSKICSFCNMRRSLSQADPSYKDLVLRQIELISKSPYARTTSIDSIYFGGGTPTTLTTDDFKEILQALTNSFKVNKNAEISTETTLNELDAKKLRALEKSGLNRISVGVQTFNDYGRKIFNRKGDGAFAKRRIAEYLDTGFRNVNIDLIYDYPNQSEEDLLEDMQTIDELDIAGFSMYSLIFKAESKLGKLIKEPLDPQEVLIRNHEFYEIVRKSGEKSGYKFLELTKMAKVQRDDYRYIVRRHQGKDTIPLGAGAGGSIEGVSTMNPISIDDYKTSLDKFTSWQGIEFIDIYKKLSIASSDIQFGYLDLGNLPEDYLDISLNYFQELERDKLVIRENNKFKLTNLGKYWGNNINQEYWELLLDNIKL